MAVNGKCFVQDSAQPSQSFDIAFPVLPMLILDIGQR
jgi:hypothetical protein